MAVPVNDPERGFCRDCLQPQRGAGRRCEHCGSPRLVRHAELYRLHRLCKEVEAATPAPSSAVYRVPQGFVRTSFPGVPTFYPEHKLT